MEGLAEPVEAALPVGGGEGSGWVCVCDLPVHSGLTAANGSLGPLVLVFPSKVTVCVGDFNSVILSQSSVCLCV